MKKISKRVLCLATGLLLIIGLLGCTTNDQATTSESELSTVPPESASVSESTNIQETEAPVKVTKIAFITNMAVDTAEWLQNLVAGLEEYQKTNKNVEIKVIEATQANEYEPKIVAACQAGYEIIITTNSPMAQATVDVAAQFPNVKFGIMDGRLENLADFSNIQDFRLNRVQTAFLSGMVAASMTKENKVGIIVGADSNSMNEIVAGWQQGLMYVNPNIEDFVSYANTFTDPNKGKELGLALFLQGCDVLAGAAGGTGVGCAQAAAETGNYYAAWDVHYSEVVPDLELGSAITHFDVMVLAFIEDVLNGEYAPGTQSIYGIEDGACEYEFVDNGLVNEEIRATVAAAEEKISNGEIQIDTVPLHK